MIITGGGLHEAPGLRALELEGLHPLGVKGVVDHLRAEDVDQVVVGPNALHLGAREGCASADSWMDGPVRRHDCGCLYQQTKRELAHLGSSIGAVEAGGDSKERLAEHCRSRTVRKLELERITSCVGMCQIQIVFAPIVGALSHPKSCTYAARPVNRGPSDAVWPKQFEAVLQPPGTEMCSVNRS